MFDERLWLSWAMSNRDPAVFPNPNEIDLARTGNRRHSFGLGIHRCIGSNVARMVFKRMLVAVLDRMPDYVYFDHSIHVAKGVGCTTCHGPVGEMPLMYQAAPLTMEWCLDCHRDPARNLRPNAKIFSLDWKPSADQIAEGHKLMTEYGIKPEHLTDCSVCHR